MLQVIDNMPVSWVFYDTVRLFTHLKESKIAVLTVNKSGIVMITIQVEMIVSISFM
jgi:hypothetical protein